VAKYGSAWHVARTQIVSSYRAFSREKVVAELGAYIGLGHVNVTLRGKFAFAFGKIIIYIVMGHQRTYIVPGVHPEYFLARGGGDPEAICNFV
jgi:hypothetical protein